MSDFDKFLALHGFKPAPKVDGIPSLKAVEHRAAVLEAELKEHLKEEPDVEDDQ